jgi:esterase/lipase superfamily enzyme
MILVSCRRDFDSNHRFSDDNQIRDHPRLQALDEYEVLDPADLRERVEGRHALVLVHGYRNPLKNVAPAYRLVEQKLKKHGLIGDGGYDEVIGFLWPGFETVFGFVLAVPWANRAAGFLRSLLRQLGASASTVDVQTHSLGARVALQALAFPQEVWIDNLMLTAPAVDNESLEPDKEFHPALDSCRRCIVYHSSRDRVLRVSYRVGAWDKALGYQGPENPDVIASEVDQVFVVDCSTVVRSHGGYRRADRYCEHWGRVLRDEPLAQFETLKA